MDTLKFRKKTDNKIHLAILTINIYCLLNNIKINKSTTEVLAYFMLYGFSKSTKDIILRSKIFTNPTSVDNTLSQLRAKGLVVKIDVGLQTDSGKDAMCEALRFTPKDTLGFIIKLENI